MRRCSLADLNITILIIIPRLFFKHWWTICRDAALRSCRLEYINPYNHTKGVFFNIDEHDAEMRRCSLADLNISILIIIPRFFFNTDEHDAEMQSCRLEYISPYNHTKVFFSTLITWCGDAEMQSCRLEYISPYNHTKVFFSTLITWCGDAEMQSCRLEYINPYNHTKVFFSTLMNMMRRCSHSDLNISILIIIPRFFFQHWWTWCGDAVIQTWIYQSL